MKKTGDMSDNHLVIMAGGIGSRFWPLSTPEFPKQFVDVLGTGRSLIQLTYDRFSTICVADHIWVVTNEKYVELVHQQLPCIPLENIIAEPEARNTAPCIAYAGWKIKLRYPNANIVVSPSDALVLETSEFQRVIKIALEFIIDREAIVTIGIRPNRPETGYGYVQMLQSDAEIHKVASFREKPSLDVAQEYIEAGNYLWNAGIFVWNVQTLEYSIRRFIPQIAGVMDQMQSSFFTEYESSQVKNLFPLCEKISIDYAVMERYPEVYTIPADFGWSDLGNWASLHQLLPNDQEGNAIVGDVRMFDCSNCVVHVADASRVVLQGLDGYIVSEKNGQLLICKRSEEQRIKEFNL